MCRFAREFLTQKTAEFTEKMCVNRLSDKIVFHSIDGELSPVFESELFKHT